MYGSAPEPPDPQQTAAAQTQTNLSTAIGNTYLGNMNQVTPYGNLTYTQNGSNFVNDPNGQTYYYNKKDDTYDLGDAHKNDAGWTAVTGYEVPSFTATTTLNDTQQDTLNKEQNAENNLAKLARQESANLGDILGKPIDLSHAPAAWDPSNLNLPNYTGYKDGPQLQTSVQNAGNIQDKIGKTDQIQTSIGDTRGITHNYDYNPDTSAYADALMARLNPQLQQDSDALNAKLINQGLQPGSEAYNRAFQQQGQKENDARIAAILNAGQEQSRQAGLAQQQAEFQNAAQQQGYEQQIGKANLNNAAEQQAYEQALGRANLNNTAQAQQYSQNLQDATFKNAGKEQMYADQNAATSANNALQDQSFNARLTRGNAMDQARSNYLNEQYANRNQGINEITSLMSGAQVQSPQFVSTNPGQIANVDYAKIVQDNYQDKLAAYQQDQQGLGQLLGGIGSLFQLSDKRAKKDIKRVGTAKGVGLYEYSMRGALDDGRRHLGVLAQDVEKKRPDAVMTGRDGLKRVNYGKLFAAGA
jgi:hypothetical protein